jgi:hypothetical protein
MLLGFSLYSHGACSGSSPSWVAASPSAADVQACIDAAQTGDTVNIPSGTATWSSVVTISNKGLTLSGATTCTPGGAGSRVTSCADNTVITLDNTTYGGTLYITGASATNFVRVTGITFTLGLAGTALASIDGAQYSTAFRFDHLHLKVAMGLGGPVCGFSVIDVYGLWDHILADDPTTQNNHFINVYGSDPGTDAGYGPWNQPSTLGTANAVFVEDSTLNCEINEECMDTFNGARFVFRYSALNGGFFSTHGTDTGPARSAVTTEIYNVIFTNSTGTLRNIITIRGGTGVVHDITAQGSTGYLPILAQYQRADNPSSLGTSCINWNGKIQDNWLACTGTALYPQGSSLGDGNSGTINSATITSGTSLAFCTQNLDQYEVYGSAGNAACAAFSPGDTATASFDAQATAQSGTAPTGFCRDQVGRGHNQVSQPFYLWNLTTINNGSPNQGSINMEDQSCGWQKSGTDFINNGSTPEPGYTAYSYPHPLQGAVAAPTDLSATVSQ